MKMQLSLLSILLMLISCSEANFGAKTGKSGASPVDPNETKPVNLGNGSVGNDGPTAGEGERLSKTIEVDCEESQGVIIDIGDVDKNNPEVESPKDYPKDPGNPDTPSGDDDDGDDDDDLGSENYFLQDDGKLVLDKDGQSKGKIPSPDKGGKGTKNPTKDPIVTPSESNITAKVKGKFCPSSSKQLKVLFVVDMSGSMGAHRPTHGQFKGQNHPGYDPQINGSCGRMRAALAIMDRMAAEVAPGDDVQVGMVAFAGGILSKKFIDLTNFSQFRGMINKDTFCQYVTQGSSWGYDPQNPGGIDGQSGLFGLGSVDSSTNYRAAFQAANTVLAPEYGRKVVYFISDGEPTSGGVDPVQAGIDAGAALRSNVDNLSLNALLLGNPGPHAQQVLEAVAGSPNRVRRAENADELAESILNFPVASIDPSTALAHLTIQPYPTSEIGFKYFREAAPNVWEYETNSFVLLGIPNTATVNLLEVTAEGTDGSTHAAVFRIRFHK
jgi:hypothetical protein